MNFSNASASIPGLNLYLDIDSKKEVIKDFFFDGADIFHYQEELLELKTRCLGQTLESVLSIKREGLQNEIPLENKERPVVPVGLWLLKTALQSYLGGSENLKTQNDLLCLCFSVSKKDIIKKVLANKDFELKTLIAETMASSACGSCKKPIEDLIVKTRHEHGLIKGFDHSKSRFDEKGQWLKIAGLYPGPLLLKLEEHKRDWMKREGILEQFTIEFVEIEGHHLSVKINSTNEKTVEGLLSALSDYLKSKMGILFFLRAL